MLQKVEMYTVVCDNCGEDIGATQEYSCWNDELYAQENAMENEWLKEGNKHYCPKCYSYDDDDNLIIRALDKSSDELGNCNKPHVMPMLLCIDTGDWIWLEKDNTYHALFEYEDKYIIKDDEGDIIAAEKELFKIIGYKSN